MHANKQKYLYQHIANDISRSITDADYISGQKLPSLREISQRYAVSMATAIKAYEKLEQEGLIEVKPKSGYFVLPQLIQTIDKPEITRPKNKPTNVNVAHLAMSLITEARHPRLIKLGAAVPGEDMLPLASFSRSLAGVARRHWKALSRYEDAQGNESLRKQIAILMRDSGYRCKANEIIITNGCLESLNIALRCVAKPGDTIAIESPTYFGVLQVIENRGMRALEIPTHPQDGIEIDALAKAIKQQKISACVLIPSYSNPLGACMPDDNKHYVVKLLEKAGIPLIENDIYGGLSYQTPRPKSAKSFDGSGNVLYCSSFSKTLSPGLRIGWIIPGRHFENVRYQKFLDNLSTTVLPQIALAEFLERGQYRRSLRQSANIYQGRMQQMQRWVAEYFPAGTRITHPQGGFLLWLELPNHCDSLALYQQAMEKRISITPGKLFSAQGQYKHHIRLSCGAVEGEQAKQALKIIGKLVGT